MSMRLITPSRSAVAAREGISGVFRGSLKARGLRPVTRNIAQYNQSEYLENVQHFFFSGVF
jgi:hypothetical protein